MSTSNKSLRVAGVDLPLAPMKSARTIRLVLVTAPNRKIARSLAKAALTAKLVACANIVPGLESHYWWQGALEHSSELLVLFKTTRSHLAALEKLILDLHPYDTPEWLVVPVAHVGEKYLSWAEANSTFPPFHSSHPPI